MKISANSPCPCGSSKKYKKCCQLFHKGKRPLTALELMKSRYSAYAVSNYKYIIDTTHKENSEYTNNTKNWEESILDFCKNCDFKSLDIVDFVNGETESFVTFKVTILCYESDNSFSEKSRFLKENGRWLYHSGTIN